MVVEGWMCIWVLWDEHIRIWLLLGHDYDGVYRHARMELVAAYKLSQLASLISDLGSRGRIDTTRK